MNIKDILETVPHNPHYLNRYLNFIVACSNNNVNVSIEKHHICPKSLFPTYSNLRKNTWNVAALTPRQHFISHLILAKIYGGKMWFALSMMITKSELNHDRNFKVTSRTYSLLRENLSVSSLGENNPSFGRKHTEEHKAKISQSLLNVPKSSEHSENISKGLKGHKKSKETLQKMSEVMMGPKNPNFGKPKSEETKRKMALAHEGKHSREPKPKVTCPHCNKEGGKPAMTRFHFDNCKLHPLGN